MALKNGNLRNNKTSRSNAESLLNFTSRFELAFSFNVPLPDFKNRWASKHWLSRKLKLALNSTLTTWVIREAGVDK